MQTSIDGFVKPENIKLDEGKVKRNFVNVNNISKHLICTICTEVFDDPSHILGCGHTFCHDCITLWMKKNKTCPMCRRSGVKEDDLVKDIIAGNMIDDLEVTCIHKACPWKSVLVNLKEHIANCFFDPTKMTEGVKQIMHLQEEEKKEPLEDEKVNSNNFLSFNPKIGLKARLYNRDKNLMEKVLRSDESKGKIKTSGKRDTLLDFLESKEDK